jgi:hypothetical protein
MKAYLAAVHRANADQRSTAREEMGELEAQLNEEHDQAVRAAFQARCQVSFLD